MTATDVRAWWGAVVGTTAFGWEIVTWRYGRARFDVSVANAVYGDSFDSETTTATGTSKTLTPYFRIDVTNVGGLPATIRGVSIDAVAAGFPGLIARLRAGPSDYTGLTGPAFAPHDANQLPHVLAAGEMWSCRVREQSVRSLFRHGTPFVRLSVFGCPVVRTASATITPCSDPH